MSVAEVYVYEVQASSARNNIRSPSYIIMDHGVGVERLQRNARCGLKNVRCIMRSAKTNKPAVSERNVFWTGI